MTTNGNGSDRPNTFRPGSAPGIEVDSEEGMRAAIAVLVSNVQSATSAAEHAFDKASAALDELGHRADDTRGLKSTGLFAAVDALDRRVKKALDDRGSAANAVEDLHREMVGTFAGLSRQFDALNKRVSSLEARSALGAIVGAGGITGLIELVKAILAWTS